MGDICSFLILLLLQWQLCTLMDFIEEGVVARKRVEERSLIHRVKSVIAAGAVTITVLLFGVVPVSAGINQWTSNGPYGGIIESLAVDPTTPTTIYAGTYFGGLFKSTN